MESCLHQNLRAPGVAEKKHCDSSGSAAFVTDCLGLPESTTVSKDLREHGFQEPMGQKHESHSTQGKAAALGRGGEITLKAKASVVTSFLLPQACRTFRVSCLLFLFITPVPHLVPSLAQIRMDTGSWFHPYLCFPL